MPGAGIGETISKIQGGWMASLAKPPMGIEGNARNLGRYRRNGDIRFDQELLDHALCLGVIKDQNSDNVDHGFPNREWRCQPCLR